ncbi:MAG: PRC-barrel domain-containing protein, partial [Planctomycetota bacterium JB042]
GDEKIVVPLGVLSHGESGEGDAVATLDVTKETLETGVRFDDALLAKLEDPAALGTIARPFQVRETEARGILPVLASDVIDRELHDADSAKLGSVSDLAIDRATGDVRYAVVLLTEADDDLFAVRWKELHPTASEEGVKLDVDAATVRNERRFPTNEWPSESDGR